MPEPQPHSLLRAEHGRVTVIIANWNGKRYLGACLESLRRQAFTGVEVILVDNGSTDGSVELAREHLRDINVIALPENLGFSRAINVGIERARGEYIAMLNNDAEADPKWLGELVAGLEANPEVGFCASKMVLHGDHDMADACGDFYAVEGVPGKIGHLEPADRYRESREVFGAFAGAALYRRSMVEELGGFDEDFFIVHEDSDLSFRARLMGYRCLYVPSAVVYHHVGATIGRESDAAVYYSQRNSEFVYLKNMPGPLVLRYWPLHLLAVLASFLSHTRRGKLRPYLRGKLDAVRMIPIMLAKRRQIQRGRRVTVPEIDGMLSRGWFWSRLRGRLPGKTGQGGTAGRLRARPDGRR